MGCSKHGTIPILAAFLIAFLEVSPVLTWLLSPKLCCVPAQMLGAWPGGPCPSHQLNISPRFHASGARQTSLPRSIAPVIKTALILDIHSSIPTYDSSELWVDNEELPLFPGPFVPLPDAPNHLPPFRLLKRDCLLPLLLSLSQAAHTTVRHIWTSKISQQRGRKGWAISAGGHAATVGSELSSGWKTSLSKTVH